MKFTAARMASFASIAATTFVTTTALAQGETAPAAQAPQTAPGWVNLALIGGMILFMWLFIIRPQAKRQKEHRTFVESLTPGKEVITQAGLIGKIVSVSDAIANIDFGQGPVRVLKSSIASELNKSGNSK
jgi:preprotein translocase subunit YajC